ncbi:MAG TPA: M2 family metallopeptidase, partial [Adhaeribacter sp.]|nr:M2 family metallopeptidase [Adhaeribacter sp.]
MKKLIVPALAFSVLYSCQSKVPSAPVSAADTETAVSNNAAIPRDFRGEADKFLRDYTATFQKLYYQSAEAEWASNTRIYPNDSTNAVRTRKANEEMARFTGSEEVIRKTRELLSQKAKLDRLQVLQLETILYKAANNPQTVADLVNQRIKAETEQSEKLYGFEYTLAGKPVTTNQLDDILREEKNLNKRLQAWNQSKEVGKDLRPGLIKLRDLRNITVQALGYDDYFSYQASEYGMTRQEMMDLVKQLNQELLPLYRELHTFARYELAKKYGMKQVPDQIPAHWLPNRWGQDWSSMVNVKGIDLDKTLSKKTAEWQAKQAERFYMSLGFPALPQTFWTKSDFYPVPAKAGYKKNNHASA